MAEIMIFTSVQALNFAPNGINPLAERLDMDATTTSCFAIMSLEGSSRNQAITTLVEKL